MQLTAKSTSKAVRQSRYPLPKENRMTIAAGFVCGDGILLSADTRLTEAGEIKLDRSKIIETLLTDDSNAVFAFAGNDYLMRMIIEECRDNLRAQLHDCSLQHFKAIVRETIKPISEDYPNETLQLLMAVRLRNDLHLLASYCAVVKEVDGYECIGSGHSIAHYVLSKSFKYFDHLEMTRFRATCALKAAKEIDEPCGGRSEMVLLRSDGTTDRHPPRPTQFLEECINKCEKLSAELLWTVFDPFMTDEHFKNNFTMIYQLTSYIRDQYHAKRKDLEMLENLPDLPQESDDLGNTPNVISEGGSHSGSDA